MYKPLLIAAAVCATATATLAQEPRSTHQAIPSARNTTILTFYSQPGLRGGSLSFAGEASNLSTFRNIESLRVTGGRWEVCDRHNFQGECKIAEGRYLTLSDVGLRQIRSARPVETTD